MTYIMKKNKGITSKLVYKADKNQILDRREYEIINSGLSGVLVQVRYNMKRRGFTLEYDISNTVSLIEYLHMMPVDKKILSSFLRQIVDVFKVFDERSMDMKKVLFDIDMVRVYPGNQKIQFIYIPITPCEFDKDGVYLIETMLQNAVFSEYEDNGYVLDLLDIINDSEDFSLYKLDVYVERLRRGKNSLMLSNNIKRRCCMCNNIINRGDRFCSGCGYRLLDNNDGVYVLRKSNQEKIYMEEFPFYFGKRKDINGYFIRDNVLISRLHAVINIEDNGYYLCDLGSTNGTYINSERIISSKKYPLYNGNSFILSNEEFVFYT